MIIANIVKHAGATDLPVQRFFPLPEAQIVALVTELNLKMDFIALTAGGANVLTVRQIPQDVQVKTVMHTLVQDIIASAADSDVTADEMSEMLCRDLVDIGHISGTGGTTITEDEACTMFFSVYRNQDNTYDLEYAIVWGDNGKAVADCARDALENSKPVSH